MLPLGSLGASAAVASAAETQGDHDDAQIEQPEARYGDPGQITAVVKSTKARGGIPAGNVEFLVDGEMLATVALDPGRAVLLAVQLHAPVSGTVQLQRRDPQRNLFHLPGALRHPGSGKALRYVMPAGGTGGLGVGLENLTGYFTVRGATNYVRIHCV